MIKYTVRDVPPHAVRVTSDRDLFGDPTNAYSVLEARLDVEALRNLEIETDDEESLEDETFSRTKHTRLSLEPNPRTQNLKTPVARAIRDSLLKRDGKFHRLNRGMLFTAEAFGYDNKTHTLSWTEEDPLLHGNVDGAHTMRIVDETVGTAEWKAVGAKLKKKVRPQFVNVQIVRGLSREEIPKIAEGRNSSVNVEEYALQEIAGEFEFIHDELAEEPDLYDKVAFKQNEIREEGKEMDVVQILQLLTLLDNEEFDDEDQPYVAYWSRKKTVKLFVAARENYQRLRRLVVSAIAVKEYVILNFEKWYNSLDGKQGKSHRFRSTKECENGKITTFHALPIFKPDLPTGVDYRLSSDGLAMPVVAALRTIVSDDDEAEWTRDPFEFLDEVGPILVGSLMDALDSHRNPVVALKRKGVWSALYDKARLHLFETERKAARTGRRRRKGAA